MLTWLKKIWKAYHSGACGLFGNQLRHPCNLDQALYSLMKMPRNAYKKAIFESNLSEDEVVTMTHHELGRWIRNNWGLWDKHSVLATWFTDRGIWHADDMSTVVIRSYYRRREGNPIKFQEQVQQFKGYWKCELREESES